MIKKVPALRGRTVVNLFFENSTRTRISFELAAKRLSADVINFSAGGSSVAKGEILQGHRAHAAGDGRRRDRHAPLLERVAAAADAVGRRPRAQRRRRHARAPDAGAAGPVHDARAAGRLEGLRVAIVGDVLHSRVARSLSFGLVKMGAEVRWSARRR